MTLGLLSCWASKARLSTLQAIVSWRCFSICCLKAASSSLMPLRPEELCIALAVDGSALVGLEVG